MMTVLNETGSVALAAAQARAEGADLWLHRDVVATVSGWTLKAAGLCQGEVCIPIPKQDSAHYVCGAEVNIAAFWRLLGRALLRDRAGANWMLGSAASERVATLTSLTAPDFELPDIHGQRHKLSDYRGKRVLLTTWSSW